VEVVALPTAVAEPQLLLDAIVDAEVVVGIPPPEAYRAAAQLKWVHHPVSGFALDADHPLYADAAVPLTNAPHAHVPAMADWVLAMMLSWAQRMEEHFLNQRARRFAPEQFVRYDEEPPYCGIEELEGSVVGVLGFGGLGEAVARRCLGFGTRVYGLARTARARPAGLPGLADGVWGPDRLAELLPLVDWLVVTCPLTPETRGMVGAAELALMKPSARIIVLSRGAIVAERALVAALEAGAVRGAAFDSFVGAELSPDYPGELLGEAGTSFPRECPLWDHPGVIITPHTSGVSPGLVDRRKAVFRENLRRHLAGEPFLRVCNKELGY
jgi:phosphoglycerate dehydrogenase-like enzyme